MLDWLTIDKTSGGTQGSVTTESVNVRANATTGRSNKSAEIIITGNTDTATFTKSVTISQTGSPLDIGLDIKDVNVSNDKLIIEDFTGVSNAKSLKISAVTEGEDVTNVKLYINNNLISSWSNSTGTIPDDPGATSQYNFKFSFEISRNPDTTKQRTLQYKITASDGNNSIDKTIEVVQGENYYINVTPTTLAFTAAGETKSLSIETNTTWTLDAS